MVQIIEIVNQLANQSEEIARSAEILVAQARAIQSTVLTFPDQSDSNLFLNLLTVFMLAIFVGYYVVWRVTPALHSPLMSVTNAISSVIIVGAILASGPVVLTTAKMFGLLAVILASINIFGGFIVTQRMLSMFKKKR